MTVKHLYQTAFKEGLQPDSDLSVSSWADSYRILSQTASSEPGRWRTSRTPYLKEVMDCLSASSSVEKIVVMKGAQTGFTETGNNWVGYVISQAPGPMLVAQPTVELGKRWSKGRLAPLIEDTPIIKGKIREARARDSGNTIQSKEFPGGIIVVTGANSAVGLRSMPVRYLFLDEIDAYPLDASGEGDPVNLAIQRTATFSRRKIFMVSTPTTTGISRIEQEFELSDKRYYHVPCPECGELQILKWANIIWDDGDSSNAKYQCSHCKTKIPHHKKTWMLEHGKWIATAKTSSNIVGFHLSSLYSPVGWFGWADIAREFIDAKNNEHLLKTWVNTKLGETWQERGEAPEWERLFERREDYPIGIAPENVVFLTAGVDVQQDRIEVEIVGWSENKESWSVDYKILEGDPARDEIWQNLEAILNKSYPHESGVKLNIMMLAIDSGYLTQRVYQWVRTQASNRVMAIKGMNASNSALSTPRKIDITITGKCKKGSIKLWNIGVSLLKSELYQWLRLSKINDSEYPSGYCHFPAYDTEYFKQLTAEQLVTRIVKGYTKREWQKMRPRNESLDCRIYARSAAIALGMDYWSKRKWDNLRSIFQPQEDAEPAAKKETLAKSTGRRIIKRSKFIG